MVKKLDINEYYEFTETLDRYLYDNDKGQQRINEMERYYNEFKDFLGKNIIDLCCGAGLFTFWLEKKGYNVIGVDISEVMVKEFKRIKEKYGFKSEIIKEDGEKLKLNEKYDTVLILGNSIWEFSYKKLINIVKNIEQYLNSPKTWIFHYRNTIKMLITGNYFTIYPEPDINAISFTYNYDENEDRIERLYLKLDKDEKYIANFYIWSAAILEAVMYCLGYKLVKRIYAPAAMCDTIDIYQK